jgi:hypothetical protein
MEENQMTIAEQIAEKTVARDRLNEEIMELRKHAEKYPYVGCRTPNTGAPGVVLLIGEHYGLPINDEIWPLGDNIENYAIGKFHPFTGTIRYVDGQPVETREE